MGKGKMLFNSIDYVVLLAVSLAVYWLTPWVRMRQLVVFAASLLFYMSWSVGFGGMLLAIIAVNWGLGWIIEKQRRKAWLLLAVAINLALLAYFKYMHFFLANAYALAGAPGGAIPPFFAEIVLPLGISFYIFELVSYQVDVFKGAYTHERNPLAFSIT